MFSITGDVLLQAKNLDQVARQIRQELGGTIGLNIDPKIGANASRLSGQIGALNKNIKELSTNSEAATTQLLRLSGALSAVTSSSQSVSGANKSITKSFREQAKAAQESGSVMYEFGRQAGLTARKYAAFLIAS